MLVIDRLGLEESAPVAIHSDWAVGGGNLLRLRQFFIFFFTLWRRERERRTDGREKDGQRVKRRVMNKKLGAEGKRRIHPVESLFFART